MQINAALKCTIAEKCQISKFFIMQESISHMLNLVSELEMCVQDVCCSTLSGARLVKEWGEQDEARGKIQLECSYNRGLGWSISMGIMSAKRPLSGQSHRATPNINEAMVPPLTEYPTKSHGRGVAIQFYKGEVKDEKKHWINHRRHTLPTLGQCHPKINSLRAKYISLSWFSWLEPQITHPPTCTLACSMAYYA